MRSVPQVRFYSLIPARFSSRPNRFLVVVRRGAVRLRAACRDPGRLRELLVPEAEVRLAPAEGRNRRTRFTLVLVRHRGRWVSVVPALANDILEKALERGGVPGLGGVRVSRREARRGRSRIDFVLHDRGVSILTEVKSATLVVKGRALFPDAPTLRGRRHLMELLAHVRRGGRALVVFVVQREDAEALCLHRENDPAFAEAALNAAAAGVGFLAYACRVSTRGIALLRRIPVRLR
jgi:sugar fermentation stimulation protein A